MQSRLLSLLGLFKLVVIFFMLLEALEMHAIPIGVPGTNSEAERCGEVDPEALPEFSGNRSDGHLVSGGEEDGVYGFVETEIVDELCG